MITSPRFGREPKRKMKATGEQTIQHFQNCCKKHSKLFIPDSPRQEPIAKAISDFYESELLFKAIESYVKSKTGPVLVFDFAIESKTYIDRVEFDGKSENKFQQILNETRKRMQDEL
jgi:hypothetical protein